MTIVHDPHRTQNDEDGDDDDCPFFVTCRSIFITIQLILRLTDEDAATGQQQQQLFRLYKPSQSA